MTQKNRKIAILAVSFGTSHEDTRLKTIDMIENDFRKAFPDLPVYRAWTSKMIIKKLKVRDHIHIFTVKEAMEQMAADGITHVIIQPTHVINGIENDQMKEDALSFKETFQSIVFGTPLLTTEEDKDAVIQAVTHAFAQLKKEQALVFMGHGTSHYANSIYAALDYAFKEKGYKNFFMGTVEAYPGLDHVRSLVLEYGPEEVILTPFMIVAGDHAKNDMSGDEENSWLRQFQKDGYQTKALIKGLGEYKEIRQLFVKHVKDAFSKL